MPELEDYALIKNQILQMVTKSIPGVRELIMLLRDVIALQHGDSEHEELWMSCYDNIVLLVQECCYQQFGEYLELE